jgi:FAD/FMN-containing dehydrogenase/Fe-S oxidoreductase
LLGMNARLDVDVAALERELRNNVRGEVRFSHGDRALYSTDGSNYRQIPIGVVIPRDRSDVIATVAACRKFGAPITCRGGGTSLAGQCCNVTVVIDFTKYYNRILEIDQERRLARVEPGIVLDELQKAAKKQGLVFGPDPATHSHCALGGMLGNNSCGVHSVMAQFYGGGARTSDNVHELEVLLYDGTILRVGKTADADLAQIIREGGRRSEIYKKLVDLRDKYGGLVRQRYPKIPRRVSGYNLDELLSENGFQVARALVGTESTCMVILEATLELMQDQPVRSLVMFGYPDIYSAGDHVPSVLKHRPVGLEGIDDVLVKAMRVKNLHIHDVEMLPKGNGWLLVEFGGDSKEEADRKAKELIEDMRRKKDAPTMKLFDDPHEEQRMWNVRDAGLGASARVPNEPDTWEGWEDAAVPPAKVGNYLRDFRALLNKYGYLCTLYGHFGQGCVHTRIDFGLKNAQGIKQYVAFTNEAADLVVRYGGSLSGEHGDGQSRGELLPKMFGEELVQAFREFKAIWDPDWKMNPGKIVRPYRRDENLRYGENYDPPQWPTHFKFPNDKGSFSYAIERCVGVGQCRRHEKGTMCPSYMVTREEKDSTRGRARLLWEMLDGQVIGKRGWREETVKDALDLCLACKGCKADCPVNVDMATYKAEFLSHYYKHRLRPVHAYAFGLIHVWARLAQVAPGVVNLVNRAPMVSDLVKQIIGVAPQRQMPAFANETFKTWFARRGRTRRPVSRSGPGATRTNRGSLPTKRRVILWPDTFNNFFHPETAKAAVEVLENAGFHVVVPDVDLCCGRPLYDYGMLDTAKRWLREILRQLKTDIESGTPVVGLEPSCIAVFRDELIELFPQNQNARRLCKQTFTLAEFLHQHVEYELPKLQRKAVVHGHCHDKAVLNFDCEKELLKKMGLQLECPDTGCCGMAGAFGFETEHVDVSLACGERVLLPAVRAATRDTLIIADGFSCREQVRQMSDRVPLHFAQVVQMAIAYGARGPAGDYPEQKLITPAPPIPSIAQTAAWLGAGVLALTVLGFVGARKRLRKD